jgi:ribosome maturation factor RimP
MNEARIAALIEEAGAKLYGTEIANEHGRAIFRIFLTCKDGVSLELCTKITHIVSPVLDLDPPIAGQYTLEVSSPGLERKLITPQHYMHSIGEMVRIKTHDDTIEGKLIEASDKDITIQSNDENHTLTYAQILKGRTFISW